MNPNAADLLHGLRRLWWIPLLAVVAGVALGLASSRPWTTTYITTANALFTMSVADPGNDAEGTARQAETELGQGRLAAYVALTRSSEELRSVLDSASIPGPVTGLSSTGGFKDPTARVLVDVSGPNGPGIVQIQFKNKDLSEGESTALVTRITEIVVDQVKAIDARQESPSIRADVVLLPPQVITEPASKMTALAAPIMVSLGIGLGLVYLLVRRRGTINTRADLEDRLGARVLAEFAGRPSDAATAALALCKGRTGTTRAVIIPVRKPGGDANGAWLAPEIAAAGRDLGYEVDLSEPLGTQPTAADLGPVRAGGVPTSPDLPAPGHLAIIDASTNGMGSQALRECTHANIVAIVVELGRTAVSDLAATVHSLRETTEAEIAVIALHERARPAAPRIK